MLTHLHIRNFTLMEDRELVFRDGLTVLTGETGAGKSILLDALAAALGDRTDADKVRAGCDRAEVAATFDVRHQQAATGWLQAQALGSEECMVRRVVTAEGRSRAFVNGTPVTLAQLRSLGNMLVDIHSQHEHQSLLRVATHRQLLDGFGRYEAMVDDVSRAYLAWHKIAAELEAVAASSEAMNARYQLLSYQVEELSKLNLQEGELQALEERQQALANYELLQRSRQQVYDICAGSEGAVDERLNRALTMLRSLPVHADAMREVESMLQTALIQVEEASRELLDADDTADDVYELPEIESRLSAIYELARKHRVSPEELVGFQQQLAAELSSLQTGDALREKLQATMTDVRGEYQQAAAQLSQARAKAAAGLAKRVNQQLKKLAMPQARFEVSLSPLSAPSRFGSEQVEFLISTIPGQSPRPLVRIASGGELSRVSLAIVVVTARTSVTPTMVFDEVDVGIGGVTGDVVGRMLRELGETAQVLCVTHLAQVASKANHHLLVEKTVNKSGASTDICELQGEQKVQEIARMMGGAPDSQQSLAHAREMIGASQ